MYSKEEESLLKCNSCYMIGKLAIEESYYPNIGDEQGVVSVMRNSDNIVFFVRALSMEPNPIIELMDTSSDLYIGIDSHQNNLPLEYKFENISRKIEIMKEMFQDKMIIFKPKITINKKGEYKNLEVIDILSDKDISNDINYIPIPRVKIDNANLEKMLIEGKVIEFDEYNHFREQPEYILCNEYLYQNEGDWARHESGENMWEYKGDSDSINRTKIKNEDINNYIIECTQSLVFISREFLAQCNYEEGENAIINENTRIDNVKDYSESDFIQSFRNYTKLEEKLCYSKKDLANLHICIKTNPLTILAGMSGTGKTQLALAYARMLGVSEEIGNLLFLPINPSYMEPNDLLGHFNNITGLFIPSETGLIDILINAEKNPNKMHMVIFDEMNLSQVEYWFAPFISLLEKNIGERKLKLYSPNAHCINSHLYKDTIEIGSNLIFVGTVNLDETTKEFSDRLLDRANLIVLNKKSFKDYYNEQNDFIDKKISFEENICKDHFTFLSWINYNSFIESFTLEELEFFDDLHETIQKFDSQKGISFRVVRKIGEYLNNIPIDRNNNYYISKEDAIDLAIKQRVITKIKGIKSQYEYLLGSVDHETEIVKDSLLYDLFNNEKAKKISHFSETKKELIRKSKELNNYGYTS